MAILSHQDLEMEVAFGPAPREDLAFRWFSIRLRWRGQPLFNPSLWTRIPHRGPGDMVEFYDWETCPILYAVDTALRTNQPVAAEPVEPQLFFSVFPPGYSDFAYEPDLRMIWRAAEGATGPGADDPYIVVLNISVWQMGGYFGGAEVGIRLVVTGAELAAFRDALVAEWKAPPNG